MNRTRGQTTAVFTAFCLFRIDALRSALTLLARQPTADWQHDISRDVLPFMIAEGQHIRAYPVPGYWADIGTVERYLLGHMELLRSPASGLTDVPQTLPGAGSMRVGPGRVMTSDPVPARAHVREAVLYPGCVVEAGAWIERSVVLPGARVTAGAEIRDTVVLERETVMSATCSRPGGPEGGAAGSRSCVTSARAAGQGTSTARPTFSRPRERS